MVFNGCQQLFRIITSPFLIQDLNFVVTSSSYEEPIFRYGERFVDEDLEEMMKNADLDRFDSWI